MTIRGAAVAKYLAYRAEPEASIAGALEEEYSNVIVVPACREDPKLAERLLGVAGDAERLLVVLVVNGREDAAPEVGRANVALLAAIQDGATANGRVIDAPPHRAVLAHGRSADVLAIDRASPGRTLASREGVGRARKIGGDIALAARSGGRFVGEWIHFTDADAEVAPTRFRLAKETEVAVPDAVAVTLPYFHVAPDPSLAAAMDLYEIRIRSLSLGLAWAGSPYAFSSIGSAIAVRADAYAAVRGVPNREAGEDFHLLAKLAKLGAIVRPSGPPVVVEGRLSDRVPFGTGPALREIERELQQGEEPRLLAGECFAALRRFLEATERLAAHADVGRWFEESGESEIAEKFGAREAFTVLARERRSGPDLRRALHTWFDGLRTMRFLHAVRDARATPLIWREALATSASTAGIDATASPREILDALRAAESGMRIAGLRAGAASAGL